MSTLQQKISQILIEHNLKHFGWTRLNRPLSMDLYTDWIKSGYHEDMSYLSHHAEAKATHSISPLAQSAIVLTVPYVPHPWPSTQKIHNRTAFYSQGKDYHNEIPRCLDPVLEALRMEFPADRFELFTDSAPILERDLAYRAGLGWIGKNTCLIDRRQGSLFFLAEIFTTLAIENEHSWSPDFCGTCNKCVEACPTQALSGQRELFPSKCIAYWTIEAKTTPPVELLPRLGDWLFGCDICQTVCPWNSKHLPLPQQKVLATREDRVAELRWILTSSRKALAKELNDSPLARAAGWKLQRNAIVVATNSQFEELIPEIKAWSNDPKLQTLVEWSLSHLDP
jgi:epoxyqueuosine reductase